MELLTLTIAAGETKRYEKAGRYIEIIDGTAAMNLFLSDRSGGRVDYAIGALSGVFLQGDFAAIELYSAVVQTITLLVTDGSGGSRRQPGNVRVIDDSASRTMLDQAFAGTITAAASAGLGSVAIIGAVGGTGKRLKITSMQVASTVAGRLLAYQGTTGGTLVPTAQLRSKWLQAAGNTLSGQSRMNAFNIAAAQPSGAEVSGLTTWFAPYVPSNTTTQCCQGGAPIVLEAGRLLVLSADQLNRDMSVWFEVEEF